MGSIWFPTIMDRKIFEQDQMKHAVAIGLGIGGPEQIDIVTGDVESEAYRRKLESILNQAGCGRMRNLIVL